MSQIKFGMAGQGRPGFSQPGRGIFPYLLAVLLFLFAAMPTVHAYDGHICLVCGKTMTDSDRHPCRWGYYCDDCNEETNRCDNCNMPIRDGAGVVKIFDGRLICKYCRPNSVFDEDEARELFTSIHHEMVGLYGSRFDLKNQRVKVSLFDVDQWTKNPKKGVEMGGYALSGYQPDGLPLHQVLLKGGLLRIHMEGMAAHEYTHLWINENCPITHKIEVDTVEAICDLSRYKLMESRRLKDEMNRVLINPYTDGRIKKLVEVENEKGIGYILDWVKNSTAPDFDTPEPAAPAHPHPATFTNTPPQLPTELKFTGLLVLGTNHEAIINGITFSMGDQKKIKLQGKTVQVRCQKIGEDEVWLQVDGRLEPVRLKKTGPK
ncbi:MAG: hypothetical protein JF609_00935 [Verrucomicrobia bacterium]|nr:hypothetical protein [Verrucomicrobiota bacterium]